MLTTYPFNKSQPAGDVIAAVSGWVDVYFGSTVEQDVGRLGEALDAL